MLDPDYEDLLPLLSVPAAQHDPGLGGRHPPPLPPGHPRHDGRRHPRRHPLGHARPSPPRSPPRTASSSWSCSAAATTGFNAFAPISGTDRTRYQTLRGGLAIPAAQLLPGRRAATGSTLASPKLRGALRAQGGSRSSAASASPPTTSRTSPPWPPSWPAPPRPSRSQRLAGSLPRRRHRVRQRHARHHLLLVGAAPPARPAGQGHRRARPGRHVGLRSPPSVGALGLRGRAGLRQRARPGSAPGATAWPPTARRPSGWPRRSTRLYHPELTTTGLVRDLTLAARLDQRQPRHPGDRRQRRRLGHALEPALRPRRAPRRARRRHRGLLHHPRPRLPRPDHAGHVLRVRAPARAQRQRRHRPRHRQRACSSSARTCGAACTAPQPVADRLRRAGQLRADGRLPLGLRHAPRPWLDGDPAAVLGGTFEQLDLFTNVPGGPRTPPGPPPPPNPAKPFADWTALVRQQYVDLLLVTPDAPPGGAVGRASSRPAPRHRRPHHRPS